MEQPEPEQGSCQAMRAPWERLLSRRELLQVGSIGLAARIWLGVTPAVAARAQATADSVILLWMAGGVTHIDSFDPKPDAPEEVRGTLGAIATRLPGVCFTE